MKKLFDKYPILCSNLGILLFFWLFFLASILYDYYKVLQSGMPYYSGHNEMSALFYALIISIITIFNFVFAFYYLASKDMEKAKEHILTSLLALLIGFGTCSFNFL
jgi:hypothetical protein